jgi:hypothetical protein
MLEVTLHLTRSSRLWTLLPLGLETIALRKERHFNRLCEDTQRRDFRPLEENQIFNHEVIFDLKLKVYYRK